MKCPSCGAQAPADAVECAACGVIFAKFAEKRKREREEAQAALARMNVPPAQVVDPQLGRKVGTLLVAAWAAVMGFFIVKEMLRKRAREAEIRAAAAAAPIRVPSAAIGVATGTATGAASALSTSTPALPAHAVVADPSGQFTAPSGEAVSNRRP